MRILSVQHSVPSRRITNQWVLQRIHDRNVERLPADQLALVEQGVRDFLEGSGTENRYGLADGEKNIDLALGAGRRALAEAEVRPEEVDLLIFAGVVRGWIEPSTANTFQHALGLTNATCFDVLDGCASWLRALSVAHAYLRAGTYRRAMIVNCERVSQCYEHWEFAGPEELEYRPAIYTVGDASTATVVAATDAEDDFFFTFRNFGQYVDLCVVPLASAVDFVREPYDARYAPMKFFSLSRELLSVTVKKIVEAFDDEPRLRGQEYDVIFGHEASEKASRVIGRRLGLPYERYVATHREYGNTIAACVPLGMSLALQDGRLRRGNKVLVMVGSAGITIGFATFTF
jgi:3-oxoacyl-[acyl-carrier-protein] synthase III